MTTGLLLPFKKEHHIRYFAASLQGLSGPYAKLDTNRMTLVHFATHALDLLGVWDNDELSETLNLSKKKIINWIYSLQRTSKDVPPEQVGFQGGTFLGPTINTSTTSVGQEYNQGHIAMTYTALCTLTALGDDLSRVDKAGIVNGLKALQRKDGSFQCVHVRSEHDMRFLYCACAVSYMLQDWSGVDIDRAVSYIESCRSFDGAIALIPEQEGHGGSTFCGMAALILMKKADEVLAKDDWRKELIQWCVHRQAGGMQGRPNKAEDTCYSYWIGGTLHLLGQDHLLDQLALRQYVMSCQFDMGGFGKVVGAYPDLLHSFYSMAWLSLSTRHVDGDENNDQIPLHHLNCTLGFRQDRAAVFGGDVP